MENQVLRKYLKIQSNLYLRFFIIGKKGYYDFIGVKSDGAKISSVIPMSSMSLPDAVIKMNEII